jgi:hypothetical protein
MFNFLSKINISPVPSKFKRGVNPHKHWRLLLQIFSIVFICLIIFSFYLLYEIKNEQIFQINKTVDIPVNIIKEKTFKNVTDFLQQRKETQNSIKNNLSPRIDPSL